MTLPINSGDTAWLGTASSLHHMLDIQEKINNASPQMVDKAMVYDDWEDNEDEQPNDEHYLLNLTENVAVISVEGSMVYGRAGFWGRLFGYTGYDDIKDAMIAGLNGGAKAMLFKMSTPGGSTQGIGALTDFIETVGRVMPIHGFTDSMSLSGGMWLMSAFHENYATDMGELGSVGVISVLKEYTKRMEAEGITVEVRKTVALKAVGNPFEKLTKEAREEIDRKLAGMHTFFVRRIADGYKLSDEYVQEQIATGQVWFGREAKEKGIVTDIKSLEEVFLALKQKTSDNTDNQLISEETTMAKSKQLSAAAVAAITAGAPVDEVTKQDQLEEGEVFSATEKTVLESASEEEQEEKSVLVSTIEETTLPADKFISELVDLKVKVAELNNQVAKSDAAVSGMTGAVVNVIQRAYVGLGLPMPEAKLLNSMDPQALLTEYHRVDGMLMQKYGASAKGRVSEATEDDDEDGVDAAAQALHGMNGTLLELAGISPSSRQ